MTNKQIANAFDELANLLELHEENEFKIKSYRNAYILLRKLEQPLSEMSDADIKSLKGIGPAISSKIRELLDHGHFKALDEARAQTPPGVVEMLEVNGFGPKKVRVVWKEMEIESIGELLYACNENRLIEYKGFGLKTQEDLKNRLTYYLKSRNQLHCDAAEQAADTVCQTLTRHLRGAFVSPVGEVRRRCSIVQKVEILIGFNADITTALRTDYGDTVQVIEEQKTYTVQLESGTTVTVYQCLAEDFGSKLFLLTAAPAFLEGFIEANKDLNFKHLRIEHEVFERAKLPYIAPELRENADVLDRARQGQLPVLIEQTDLRGVLHVHTTWSDGLHSLRDMCIEAQELGYEYIGITDHSQSAFYANGLKPDRVLAQMAEIDQLNLELAPFRIFKGIESDILSDGALDYDDALLAKFDFVIASVHSNLKMTKERATERVLRAIENPYTTILGHPTGRLLLSREGYELDWKLIFEACAKYKVTIELNAHPYRLDLDWTLIEQATSLGIRISINPDAHSKEGMALVRYGVQAARKGGLTSAQCLNALDLTAFDALLTSRSSGMR